MKRNQDALQAMKYQQGKGIIEGVKGMLNDPAIGGGELTLARFKEEFHTPLFNILKSSLLPS